MDVSIILICHNSSSDIVPCINSIVESCSSFEYEILAVDNGSSDNSADLLLSYSPKLFLIKNEKNLGVSKARNQALRLAKGKYIWILDIDTIVNKPAFEGMMAFLSDNLSTGLCSCKLVNVKGIVQNSCRKFPTIKYKLINLFGNRFKSNSERLSDSRISVLKNEQFYYPLINGNKPFNVDYVIGACQLFRNELLEKVGLLDEAIFYGPEDAEFCMRIQNAGYNITYIPTSSIIHHYNRETNRKPVSILSIYHFMGLLHFWRKRKSIQKAGI
jgi:GT2 family glycosyltransferase